MDRILLEAAHKIENASNLVRVWSVLVEAMGKNGIDYIIYITAADEPPADTRVISNLPGGWPANEAGKSDFFDPFLVYCCATFEVTKIGPEYLGDHDYIGDETHTYVQKASQFGWRSGLTFPCRLKGSGRHGGFVMGNGFDRFVFDRKTLPLAGMLQSFCLIAHRKIEDLQNVVRKSNGQRSLSARERQTLDLIAKGLRPKQIAHVLDISEASVRLYLKNARLKLGAATKEEAVARMLELSS